MKKYQNVAAGRVNGHFCFDRRASQPPFWRIFQLDRAVGPPSPCSSRSTVAHHKQHGGRMHQLDWAAEPPRVVYRVGNLDHFSMATPSPPHRAPISVWFYNHFPPLRDQGVLDHLSMWPSLPQQCFLDGGPPTPSVGPESMLCSSRGVNALTSLDCRASQPPF